MYGPQGNLDSVSIKGNEQAAEGWVIAGSYPDLSTAPWKDYRAAIDQYNADGRPRLQQPRAAWARGRRYTAFKKIVEGMKRHGDGKSFMDAGGRDVQPRHGGHGPDAGLHQGVDRPTRRYRRLFNHGVVFSQVKDGKIQPLTTDFEDVSAAALGKSG